MNLFESKIFFETEGSIRRRSGETGSNHPMIEELINLYFSRQLTMEALSAVAVQNGVDIDTRAAERGFGDLDSLSEAEAASVVIAVALYFTL